MPARADNTKRALFASRLAAWAKGLRTSNARGAREELAAFSQRCSDSCV
jgi:hypothetical protein